MVKRISGIFSLISIILITVFSVSCQKNKSAPTYFETVSTKYINQVIASGNKLWVLSSTPQKWVDIGIVLPPYQISVIDLETGEFIINEEIPAISAMTLDNLEKPVLATFDRRILKVNEDLSWEEFFKLPAAGLIQRIVCSQDDYIAIPTYTSGLYLYNGTDTLILDTPDSTLKEHGLTFLVRDMDSNIWFTQISDLFMIDRNKKIIRDPERLPYDNPAGAAFLSADKDNALWVSKWDGNDHRIFKKAINSYWVEIPPPESSGRRPIKFIRSDSSGRIWIAYSQYPKDLLAYYESGKWNVLQIPLNNIVILDVDTWNDEIIIGTSEGIYRTKMK